MADYLRERYSVIGVEGVNRMLARGDFVLQDGSRLTEHHRYQPHTFVWFHRELREEPEVPGDIPVLYRDERIVVVDKPHFLASIPRGRHIRQSVVVRMREELGLSELSPAHRLDRLTAGVLVLTTEKGWRAPYQDLFAQRRVTKTYQAIAPYRPELELPRVVQSHIHKERGIMQAWELPGREPNSRTLVELLEHGEQDAEGTRWGRYLLTPHTGRTHQLRLHLNSLGVPIRHDPLYPVDIDKPIDDFDDPLQLLAWRLDFGDPIDGTMRRFESARGLDLPGSAAFST
ncbi:pseudouridine synthase [Aestuariimicrobium sp. p3-SID1156]|uniref:pseudouridine synthase n=1 Tax=Aestuariimicrobium sp. p3-SID1156 TaxID=2916038 RepID=UPI00223A809F|nr:pseudouridine synthase [Aestuariimicrobium sp. p3-SID1156]MCT1458023.1 pseudouridine synthase [Aestuariimicrobium sp. p3-SID1156]